MSSNDGKRRTRRFGGLTAFVVCVMAFEIVRRTWFEHDAEAQPSAPSAEQAPATAQPPAVAQAPAPRATAADFVDEAQCTGCHAAQAAAWRGSDHDLAMQEASDATVLGDFSGARFHDPHFEDGSNDAVFTHDAHGFALETTGPDGARARFGVPYVFGVRPLQQVLVPLARGRLQAFDVAWDVAGKRWFSLQPGERIDSRDELHWTRAPYNWNFACAECHATNLKRNYDAAKDTYATTWSRLDVGCQACHGPGKGHVDWVRATASGHYDGPTPAAHGFSVSLVKGDATSEVEACARCHARRAPLGDGFEHAHRLMDDYLPALLDEGLYYADGQIQDEVYEYGSFLQSKMHARGVRCSDCHDPHALRPRREGNLLCTSCHSPTPAEHPGVDLSKLARKNYDTPEHHHHAPGTSGALCVDCHMPVRNYMVVDPRRDHGFRVPRPDLASAIGAPDACTGCHKERDAAWAAREIAGWSGPKERGTHFGVALQAGRTGRTGAAQLLLALAASNETPIVRATALSELLRYPSRAAIEAFGRALSDPDGLVRLSGLRGFELLGPADRVEPLGPLLADPLRAVRSEAARLLAGLDDKTLGAHVAAAHAATAEYVAIQRALLERPEAHLNLAQLALSQGKNDEAERELRAALALDPLFVPGYVNLADLVRASRGEAEAERVLRDGLAQVPEAAAVQHALGLALVRQKRPGEGLTALARALELAPGEARFAFVYAVALHDLGQPEPARAVLQRAIERSPGVRDLRFALAGYLKEAGDESGAQRCLAELAAINPGDPELPGAVAPGPQGR